MARLRVDPWDPEYGGSYEVSDPAAEGAVRLDIEGTDWKRVARTYSNVPPRFDFIDGVRRIDIRLFAEDSDRVGPALAGSWAVGVVKAGRPPSVERVRIGRALVVGGGLEHPGVEVQIGQLRLAYRYSGVPGTTPADPIQGLQNAMRRAEAELAVETIRAGLSEVLIMDGPLTYFAENGPVLGLIKRQSRAYLPGDRAALLAELTIGERTPLFSIVGQQLERYSFYTRIGERRRIDGVMTGIVRVEVLAEVGATEAARLANLASAALPHFATEIGRDPRAPQNLYPVSQLESTLHHRLGDSALIKRAFEAALWSDNA